MESNHHVSSLRDPQAADAVEALLGLHNTVDESPDAPDTDDVDIQPTGRRPRSGPLRDVQHKYVVPAHLQPFDELWDTRPRTGIISHTKTSLEGVSGQDGDGQDGQDEHGSDVPESTTMMQHGSAGAGSPPAGVPALYEENKGINDDVKEEEEESGTSPVVVDGGIGGSDETEHHAVEDGVCNAYTQHGDDGAPPSKRLRVEHSAFAPIDTCASHEQVRPKGWYPTQQHMSNTLTHTSFPHSSTTILCQHQLLRWRSCNIVCIYHCMPRALPREGNDAHAFSVNFRLMLPRGCLHDVFPCNCLCSV